MAFRALNDHLPCLHRTRNKVSRRRSERERRRRYCVPQTELAVERMEVWGAPYPRVCRFMKDTIKEKVRSMNGVKALTSRSHGRSRTSKTGLSASDEPWRITTRSTSRIRCTTLFRCLPLSRRLCSSDSDPVCKSGTGLDVRHGVLRRRRSSESSLDQTAGKSNVCGGKGRAGRRRRDRPVQSLPGADHRRQGDESQRHLFQSLPTVMRLTSIAPGDHLRVVEVIAHIPRPLHGPPSDRMEDDSGGSFSVFVAAGPYSSSEDLSYEALKEIASLVASSAFDLVILTGPFLDEKHPVVSSGRVTRSFQRLYQQQVEPLLYKIETNCRRLMLIPSVRDVQHKPVFPQPPFPSPLFKSSTRRNVSALPNPATFVYSPPNFRVERDELTWVRVVCVQTEWSSVSAAKT